MGWENYHLYEFKVHDYRIGEPNEDFEDYGFGGKRLMEASAVTLNSIITGSREKFEYEYDFGDGWRHQIVVEKFLPHDSKTKYPICVKGKLNCPPEDCGGVGGFYRLLDIIGNKKHPEHKEMLEWIGGHYDPDHFDIDKINKTLKELDRHLNDWADYK